MKQVTGYRVSSLNYPKKETVKSSETFRMALVNMRMLKIAAQGFGLLVVLPVVIVAVLGIAFSPLQPVARAVESPIVFQEVNDLPAR